MKKFCVFCGRKPVSKSNEHVLPAWLIELTGDPSRTVNLGFIKTPDAPLRRFAFNAFKFPSCSECNQSFGILEERSKRIMHSILGQKALSRREWSTLLDWFDKVRVGLWLAHYYLDKNFFKITPKFQIEKRIGAHDRLLAIYQSSDPDERLTFMATDTPLFQNMPSCFGLVVNHVFFLSLSSAFLFARRLGFPFASKTYYLPDQNDQGMDFEKGRNRVMLPLLKKPFRLRPTVVYQPMYRYLVADNDLRPFYESDYVRQHSIDLDDGVGSVFYQSGKGIKEYPEIGCTEWIPTISYPRDTLKKEVSIEVLESQVELSKLGPSLDLLPKIEERAMRQIIGMSEKLNQMLISRLLEEE